VGAEDGAHAARADRLLDHEGPQDVPGSGERRDRRSAGRGGPSRVHAGAPRGRRRVVRGLGPRPGARRARTPLKPRARLGRATTRGIGGGMGRLVLAQRGSSPKKTSVRIPKRRIEAKAEDREDVSPAGCMLGPRGTATIGPAPGGVNAARGVVEANLHGRKRLRPPPFPRRDRRRLPPRIGLKGKIPNGRYNPADVSAAPIAIAAGWVG
jgi:hypothetical protein